MSGNGDMGDLEAWLGALLTQIDGTAQRKLAREIGQSLRRTQARRIAAQLNPDGSAFEARKPQQQTKARQRPGRIRRDMFAKLRTTRHLKLQVTEDGVSIGFLGRTARIARVHQDGLRDEVQPGGPTVKYPERQLLGFTSEEIESIKDMLLAHITSGR